MRTVFVLLLAFEACDAKNDYASTFGYWKDTLLHWMERYRYGTGAGYHLRQEKPVQHAGRNVALTYEDVASGLNELPTDIILGKVKKPNNLAEFELSELPWTNDTSSIEGIMLASDVEVHATYRATLNNALARGDWGDLRQSARDYLDERDELRVLVDVCGWVLKENWRILLGLEITPEETEEFCGGLQPTLRNNAIAPDFISRLPLVDLLRHKLAKKLYGNFHAIATEKTGDPFSGQSVVDSAALAGGLAVPHLIVKTLWVLYDNDDVYAKSPVTWKDVEDEDVLVKLVLEIARRMPEVPAVAANGPENGTLLSIEAAGLDPAVWGNDVDKIDIDRKVDRSKYRIFWADQANDLVPPEHRRGCPGLQLSIDLIKSFVSAFNEQHATWKQTRPLTCTALLGQSCSGLLTKIEPSEE